MPSGVVHAFQTSATGALMVLVTTMSGASDCAIAPLRRDGEQRRRQSAETSGMNSVHEAPPFDAKRES